MLAVIFLYISVAVADSTFDSKAELKVDLPLEQIISFDQIRPILENRCMNCHGHSSTGAIFIDWSDYNVSFERRDELKLRVVELRNMPMYSKMPNQERELIRLWIEQGAVQ